MASTLSVIALHQTRIFRCAKYRTDSGIVSTVKCSMPFSSRKVHAVFDPETIALLTSSLEGAWAQLSRAEQGQTNKSVLAERILRAAAQGERDGARLREAALKGKPEEQDAAE